MKQLIEYINEAKQIKLPYDFDIYNSGPKNVKFKITKANISKAFFAVDKNSAKYDQMIALQFAPQDLHYEKYPSKSNTDNWTKAPTISEFCYAGGWYSDKWIEYGYRKYQEDWDKWLNSIRPYIHGRISATLYELNDSQLAIRINDKKFNDDYNKKKQELEDVASLKKYKDEDDAYEKRRIAELERKNKEAQNISKSAEDYTGYRYYDRPGMHYDGD